MAADPDSDPLQPECSRRAGCRSCLLACNTVKRGSHRGDRTIWVSARNANADGDLPLRLLLGRQTRKTDTLDTVLLAPQMPPLSSNGAAPVTGAGPVPRGAASGVVAPASKRTCTASRFRAWAAKGDRGRTHLALCIHIGGRCNQASQRIGARSLGAEMYRAECSAPCGTQQVGVCAHLTEVPDDREVLLLARHTTP